MYIYIYIYIYIYYIYIYIQRGDLRGRRSRAAQDSRREECHCLLTARRQEAQTTLPYCLPPFPFRGHELLSDRLAVSRKYKHPWGHTWGPNVTRNGASAHDRDSCDVGVCGQDTQEDKAFVAPNQGGGAVPAAALPRIARLQGKGSANGVCFFRHRCDFGGT